MPQLDSQWQRMALHISALFFFSSSLFFRRERARSIVVSPCINSSDATAHMRPEVITSYRFSLNKRNIPWRWLIWRIMAASEIPNRTEISGCSAQRGVARCRAIVWDNNLSTTRGVRIADLCAIDEDKSKYVFMFKDELYVCVCVCMYKLNMQYMSILVCALIIYLPQRRCDCCGSKKLASGGRSLTTQNRVTDVDSTRRDKIMSA